MAAWRAGGGSTSIFICQVILGNIEVMNKDCGADPSIK